MPVIAPFKALRFGAQLQPSLGKLVAPPYDVIAPAEQDALYAAHPNNVVRLTLPREDAGRYAAAARDLGAWLEQGVLVEDPAPALYVVAQRYTLPTGEEQTREGVIAAVRLPESAQPAAGQGVLAHERTRAEPILDRAQLLAATQANLCQPFALYEDADRAIDARLTAHRGEPIARFRTADGVAHTLWRVTHAETIAFVAARLANAPLVLADGHHRYEAALRHRDAMRARYPSAGPNASFEFLPMYLCSAAHPGLTVAPAHRLLAPGIEVNPDKLIEGLSRHFFITQRLTPPATSHGARLLARELASASEKGPAFAVSVPKMPTSLVCILKPGVELDAMPGLPEHAVLKRLDVTVLHALCLEPLLALSEDRAPGAIEYAHDTIGALERVATSRTPAAFFLPAPRVSQVFAVATAGARMPAKSTFFYPKLPSGLVLRRVDPTATLQPA